MAREAADRSGQYLVWWGDEAGTRLTLVKGATGPEEALERVFGEDYEEEFKSDLSQEGDDVWTFGEWTIFALGWEHTSRALLSAILELVEDEGCDVNISAA